MSLKKQITISPELLKNSGSSYKKEKQEKKPKIKMNKPSKLKKELLKRIQNHKESNKKDKEEDVKFSSDFEDSMKYLMDIIQNSKTTNKNRTVKNRKLRKSNPHIDVNLSIPNELINIQNPVYTPVHRPTHSSAYPSIQTPIQHPSQTPIQHPSQTPIQRPSQPPIQRPSQPPIQRPSQHPSQTPIQTSIQTPIQRPSQTPIQTPIPKNILPDVPYGVLKEGKKPTYRMWLNKTQKSRPEINEPLINKKMQDEKLNHLKDKFGIFSKPIINNEKKEKKKKKRSLIKKKYSTIRKKYTLGQNKTTRKISVLIKNKELMARVQVERSMLRSKPLHVMKNYLYSRGILKIGNSAPKELIKKIYEDAILTGDINNTSKDVLIYNYLNKKEE